MRASASPARIAGARLVEVAPRMRPTSHLDDVARRIDAVEDIGGVGLEEALVFFEDARRSIVRLRGGVVVDRVRMIAVADECPQASRLVFVLPCSSTGKRVSSVCTTRDKRTSASIAA